MDAEERAQALARLAEMKRVADETTQALGLPMDLSPHVMRVIYSDRLPPEARGALKRQRKKPIQSRRAAWANAVTIGSIVTLQAHDGETRVIRLVNSYQLKQPAAKTRSYSGYKLIYPVSDESPIGEALMGHRVGDRVRVPLPGMKIALKEYIILNIKYENRWKL